MLGLEGFLEAKILVDGLRRSGPKLMPEGIVKALETLRDFDLGGFFVNYSHQAHTDSLFVEIDLIGLDGKLSAVTVKHTPRFKAASSDSHRASPGRFWHLLDALRRP